MKLSNNSLQYISYGILLVLFFFIIMYCFNYKYKVVQNLSFREKTNLNSNLLNSNNSFGLNTREGFTLGSSKSSGESVDILEMINRKIRSLGEELGGESGKREIRDILKKTKKVCDMECAKCMMQMMDDHKGSKTIDLDNLADDDSSEYCIKCKKYTALSDSLKSMIDNL
tara:strand:+ start:868 stop:1377 length:510 start_codon:yes stop_codon:yes gene_type:complete